MNIVETKYDIYSNDKCNYTLLADFHGSFNITLAKSIRDTTTDYVIIAGDLANGNEWSKTAKVNEIKRFLSIIAEVHPVIIVLGNHDLYKITEEGFKNFKELERIKNVYPLYNEYAMLNNNRFTNILPRNELFSSATQDSPSTIDELVDFYSRIKVDDNSEYIEHLVAHNPYHFVHKEMKDIISKYDMIETGHFHSGWIPTKYLISNFETVLDKGVQELIQNKIFNTDCNSLTTNPRRNLARGLVYIYEDGYYLFLGNNKLFFYNKDHNRYYEVSEEELFTRLKNDKVPAIIISGAVNTFLNLKIFYPSITNINLNNKSNGVKTLLKTII